MLKEDSRVLDLLSPAEREFVFENEGGLALLTAPKERSLSTQPGARLKDYYPEIFLPEIHDLIETDPRRHRDLIQSISCLALIDMEIKPATVLKRSGRELLGQLDRLGFSSFDIKDESTNQISSVVFNRSKVKELIRENNEALAGLSLCSPEALILDTYRLPIADNRRNLSLGLLFGYPKEAIGHYNAHHDPDQIPYTLERAFEVSGIPKERRDELINEFNSPFLSDSSAQLKLWEVLNSSGVLDRREINLILESFDHYTLKTRSFGVGGASWIAPKNSQASLVLECKIKAALIQHGISFYTCETNSTFFLSE